MPLTRLKDEYLEEDGVRFSMADENGTSVACRVSHEALRDHADRLHLSGTDGAVFDVYRELIEEVASAAYDAESPLDDHGTFAPFRTTPSSGAGWYGPPAVPPVRRPRRFRRSAGSRRGAVL